MPTTVKAECPWCDRIYNMNEGVDITTISGLRSLRICPTCAAVTNSNLWEEEE